MLKRRLYNIVLYFVKLVPQRIRIKTKKQQKKQKKKEKIALQQRKYPQQFRNKKKLAPHLVFLKSSLSCIFKFKTKSLPPQVMGKTGLDPPMNAVFMKFALPDRGTSLSFRDSAYILLILYPIHSINFKIKISKSIS